MKSQTRLLFAQQIKEGCLKSDLSPSVIIYFSLFLLLSLTPIQLSYAEETPVSLKNISSKVLGTYKTPKLIDGSVTKEKIRQLRAGTEALIHMSEMISETHARKAMQAQIDSLKATLNQLETQIQNAATVDYSFPTPLPRLNESRSGKRNRDRPSRKDDTASKKSKRHQEHSLQNTLDHQAPLGIKAMNATQTSRLWGAIERASFRNDKMAVIHKITREHYLNIQQAELFVESLTFSKDRRDAIKLLYPRLVDPSQVNVLYHLLDQPAHRREVKQVVEQVNMNRRLQRAQ